MNAHLGFNPRAQSHSDALSDFVIEDLRAACPPLGTALDSGEVKGRRNAEVRTRATGRNIDLVICENDGGPLLSTRISVAYSNHIHNHRRDCVAGGIVVVNTSPVYENPDAFARGLRRPTFRMEKVVADTIKILAEHATKRQCG